MAPILVIVVGKVRPALGISLIREGFKKCRNLNLRGVCECNYLNEEEPIFFSWHYLIKKPSLNPKLFVTRISVQRVTRVIEARCQVLGPRVVVHRQTRGNHVTRGQVEVRQGAFSKLASGPHEDVSVVTVSRGHTASVVTLLSQKKITKQIRQHTYLVQESFCTQNESYSQRRFLRGIQSAFAFHLIKR